MEFRLASGNAGTGRASEAHLNMDVNLRRLPERTKCKSKFPVPLAGFMLHPHPADSAVLPSKQAEMADRLDDLGKGDFENVG